MKGHRHCTGEFVEVHQFAGKTTERALSRLGRWLDKHQGIVHSITFCDSNGEPLHSVWSGAPGLPGPVYAVIAWSAQ